MNVMGMRLGWHGLQTRLGSGSEARNEVGSDVGCSGSEFEIRGWE